jgi:hypothetical protein
MSKFARGKYAQFISDRSGQAFPYKEMVTEWNGLKVHFSEYEPKQPQLDPAPPGADPQGLQQARPDRTEPPVTVLLPDNPFTTYQAGSSIINIFAPGHGLTNGNTYVFRGATTATAAYNDPQTFDGITGSNIAYSSGYAITTGLYKDGSRVSSDYATENYFYFTVNTDTATLGNVSGGGSGCSVGPITISS